MYSVPQRPAKPEKKTSDKEDILQSFEEGMLGKLPIIRQAIQAVRAYNAKLKEQQEIIDQVRVK
tara:strand:+ start:2179 stop:2370 length:192 start_codon:yes stop_codon:yes gene_type:complete